jgi:hypothetical protein
MSEYKVYSRSLSKSYERISQQAMKQFGKKSYNDLSPAEVKRFGQTYSKLIAKDKPIQAYQKRSLAIYEKISALKPQEESAGYVWVYLRK